MGDLAARLEGMERPRRSFEPEYVDLLDIAERHLTFSELSLETAEAIASALDVPVVHLMQFDHPLPGEALDDPNFDARTLLALLSEMNNQPVSLTVLERSTGWAADRFQLAVRAANQNLVGTGIKVIADEHDHLLLKSSTSGIDREAIGRLRAETAKRTRQRGEPDEYAVVSSLSRLARGDEASFRRMAIDPESLETLVEEGVIEAFGEGYWFTRKTIDLLGLDLVSVDQMKPRDTPHGTSASDSRRGESLL